MALAGTAALAMWWDIAPPLRADFAHWHAHEHFPERLALPGFRRASRWTGADGGEAMFVLYELADHAALSSPAYLARLNAPTPWSARLMPHHRHMVRAQCHVLESRGGLTARAALTVRLTPAPGREAALQEALRHRSHTLPAQPGLTGLHLLRHQAPAIAATAEQRLRGLADQAPAWVLIATAYDAQALDHVATTTLAESALVAMGAAPGAVHGRFELAYSAIGSDTADAPMADPAATPRPDA